MKSKFKFWAYLVAVFSMVFTGLIFMIFTGDVLNKNMGSGPFIIFVAFFVFVWIWIVFGELKQKAISVDIKDDRVSTRSFLGLGPRNSYAYQMIEGYTTSILVSNSGNYEYLYLIVNGKKAVKISEFYHANYDDLKKAIVGYGYKNKGFEPFNYFRELKEIFM